MRWMEAALTAALVALVPVWGWSYASPRWTLDRMRAAALAHDLDALAAYVDYPALRADFAARQRASVAELLAGAPPEIRPRVAASLKARWTDAEIDRVASPEMLRIIFGHNRSYWGWASGVEETGRRERIAVSSPDEFRVFDRNEPYPHPDGDLTFRRHGLGWKLVAIGARGESFPEQPPPAWWERVLAGYAI